MVEALWFIFEIVIGYSTKYAVTRKRMIYEERKSLSQDLLFGKWSQRKAFVALNIFAESIHLQDQKVPTLVQHFQPPQNS